MCEEVQGTDTFPSAQDICTTFLALHLEQMCIIACAGHLVFKASQQSSAAKITRVSRP